MIRAFKAQWPGEIKTGKTKITQTLSSNLSWLLKCLPKVGFMEAS